MSRLATASLVFTIALVIAFVCGLSFVFRG